MDELTRAHLDERIAVFSARDQELPDEVRYKLRGVSNRDLQACAIILGGKDQLVDAQEQITGAGRFVTETIVRPDRRPILTIRENRVTSDFVESGSSIWTDRILGAETVLDRVIPAVGRIEVANSTGAERAVGQVPPRVGLACDPLIISSARTGLVTTSVNIARAALLRAIRSPPC